MTTRAAHPAFAIPEILSITFRQLLGRRRTVLLLLLSGVPVLIALVYRAVGADDIKNFSDGIFDGVAVTILLPIVAVLCGTAAFGAEIEDGTVVYLLAKPVARWRILLAKLAGAAGFTVLLTVLSVVVTGLVGVVGQSDEGTAATLGFTIAMIVGSLCYTSVFVALSLFTRRALVIGLGYVLIWEGGLANLLPGIANLSIRQYALGAGKQAYDAISSPLSPNTAFILGGVLLVAAAAISIWRLARFELPSSSD